MNLECLVPRKKSDAKNKMLEYAYIGIIFGLRKNKLGTGCLLASIERHLTLQEQRDVCIGFLHDKWEVAITGLPIQYQKSMH